MGEKFMNQVDIDRLLSVIATADDESNEEESGLIDITNARVYRRFPKPLSHAKGQYRSPLIKSERILYNPAPGMPPAGNKVVVRSLHNYAMSKRTA